MKNNNPATRQRQSSNNHPDSIRSAASKLSHMDRIDQGYWSEVYYRLVEKRLTVASFCFIITLIIAALFGPLLSSHTYDQQHLKLSNIPPYFQVYSVEGSDQHRRYFFVNPGNFKLYSVSKEAVIQQLLRPSQRDIIEKTNHYNIGGQTISVHYAQQPIKLTALPGIDFSNEGIWWNTAYLFGTDSLGRDILVRLLYGARISLTVAFVATIVNLLIGVIYGGISGYLGGLTDNLMMRFVEIVATIPLTLYVILIMVLLESGLLSIIIAIGSVFWVDMARIVRGQVLSLKTQEYIASAKCMGANMWQILSWHLLPNCIGPILVTMTLLIPSAIFIESFMSFIGLGVSVPMASWGTLTVEAVETLRSYPYQLFFPALAISLTLFAFNFLGDALRDAMDPKLT